MEKRNTLILTEVVIVKQRYTGARVIVGGSRRPDASPFYAPQVMQSYPPRPDWLKIYEITGRENRVWRKANLVIYKMLGA